MSGFVGLFKPLLNHGESTIARGGRAALAALREILAVDETTSPAGGDLQMTLKVAEPARDTMVEIAAMMRSDPAFLLRLRNFVEDAQRPTLASAFDRLAERLETIERHVLTLTKDVRAVKTKVADGKLPVWTTGQGANPRLTVEGEAEAARLIDQGLTDTDVALRIGVSVTTIRKRRRDLDRTEFEASLKSGLRQ